jgi:hypothetical protein
MNLTAWTHEVNRICDALEMQSWTITLECATSSFGKSESWTAGVIPNTGRDGARCRATTPQKATDELLKELRQRLHERIQKREAQLARLQSAAKGSLRVVTGKDDDHD